MPQYNDKRVRDMNSGDGNGKEKSTDERMLALYGEWSVKEIAEELGVSKTTVINRAKKLGLTRREKRKRVDEEVRRLQGQEIVKRVDEFKLQLKKWFNALEQDVDDYLCLERYWKARIDEQIKRGRVRPESIERSFEQLRKIKDDKLKRLCSLAILISAFIDDDFGWGKKLYSCVSPRRKG